MAPTEILAEQHYNNMTELVRPLSITVRSLTGSRKKKEKRLCSQKSNPGKPGLLLALMR